MKELNRDGESVWFSVISVEEYLREIYYLYLDDESKLKKKLRGAMRDLSPFEIIPIHIEIVLKAAEIDVLLAKK